MEYYKVLGHSIGKHRCVSINEYDKCLAGELGEIWEHSPGLYKAYFCTGKRQPKIISFNLKYLYRWVLKLKVPANPHDQLAFANKAASGSL